MTFVNSTNGGTWEIDMETFELEWRPYIYANKNRVYKSTNLPFYKFSPTPQELKAYEDEQNEIKRIKEIERKRKLDEKRNGKAKATETTKKTKRKRQSMGGHHLVRVSDAIPGPSSQSKSPNSSSQGKRINIDFRVSWAF